MQYLVNKIVNNISVSVHNLVLKYVDGDHVLSLSCKSIELGPADLNWAASYTVILPFHISSLPPSLPFPCSPPVSPPSDAPTGSCE